MPLWKCHNCHHEWEAPGKRKCDWCKCTQVHILEEQTPLERMVMGARFRRLMREISRGRQQRIETIRDITGKRRKK